MIKWSPRWQSRRTCTHLLLQELQNYNLLLINHQQENVGSQQKKIPYIQGQRRSPSKMVAAAAAKSLQSCPTLCDPIDGSPSGSNVPGILQARTLEWVAISFSNAWKWKVKVKSLSRVQLLATPWTAAYLPGSSIPGIFQARVLEWAAIAFSPSPPNPPWGYLLLLEETEHPHIAFHCLWRN